MSTLPAPRRFTLAEYLRMAEAGVLQPTERVELIDGQVVAMSPHGPVHSALVPRISRELDRWFPAECFCVRQQATLPLGDEYAPEPDIAVVTGRCEEHEKDYPRDVVLVVEVADSSLKLDRGRKAELYGRAGIGDYWIVNVVEHVLEIRREPSAHGYKLIRLLQPDDPVLPLALEGSRAVPARSSDFLPRR